MERQYLSFDEVRSLIDKGLNSNYVNFNVTSEGKAYTSISLGEMYQITNRFIRFISPDVQGMVQVKTIKNKTYCGVDLIECLYDILFDELN